MNFKNKLSLLRNGISTRVDIRKTTSIDWLKEVIRAYEREIEELQRKKTFCEIKISQLGK